MDSTHIECSCQTEVEIGVNHHLFEGFSRFDIKCIQDYIPQSDCVVVRLNQTIRRLLANNVPRMFLSHYEELYHSTIKMSPKVAFNFKNQKPD